MWINYLCCINYITDGMSTVYRCEIALWLGLPYICQQRGTRTLRQVPGLNSPQLASSMYNQRLCRFGKRIDREDAAFPGMELFQSGLYDKAAQSWPTPALHPTNQMEAETRINRAEQPPHKPDRRAWHPITGSK